MALTEIPKELSSTPGIVDNSNATAITIDASENVGIGTSDLKGSRVQAAGAAASVSPTLGSATDTSLLLTNSDVTYGMNFGVINSGNGWIQQHSNTGTATAYNLLLQPVGGNVGIGTSSFNATYDPRLQVTSDANDGTGGVLIQNYLPTLTLEDISGGAAVSQIQQDQTNMLFKNNGAEAMRIDATGNLLVGKTSSDLTTDGFEVRPTGFVGVRTNGDPLYLNRKSTDGTIATFAKDGTTVGSIGTTGGGIYLGSPSGAGKYFANNGNFSPSTDGTKNLGDSTLRWQDLFIGNDIAHLDAADNPRLLYDKSVNLLGNAGTNVEAFNVTASGNIIPTGGSATAGSIWKSGANLLISMDTGGFYVNNSANTITALQITDAGNVGIGAVPEAWGAGVVGVDFGTYGALVDGTNVILSRNAYYDVAWKYKTTDHASSYWQGGGGEHIWQTAASGTADAALTWSESMRIDASGSVGIGTIPDAWKSTWSALDIGVSGSLFAQDNNTTGLANNLFFTGSNWFHKNTGPTALYQQSVGEHLFYTNASQSAGATFSPTLRMTLDVSGNVGIGTSSPASALDIRSANTAVQSRGNLYVTTDSVAAINEGAQISLGGTYTGANETFFAAIAARKENATVGDYNAYLQFSVRNTGNMSEKMRIDSSGNLLVKATAATNQGVTIYGSGANGIYSATTSTSAYWITNLGITSATGTLFTFYNNATSTGGISITSTNVTNYNSVSDQRLKENIADADDAGSKIDAIQVRKFDWKSGGEHQDYGFIAQELLEVAPVAVSVPEDPEEMMAVDPAKLVPMMLKEIQSLRARVAQLEE